MIVNFVELVHIETLQVCSTQWKYWDFTSLQYTMEILGLYKFTVHNGNIGTLQVCSTQWKYWDFTSLQYTME